MFKTRKAQHTFGLLQNAAHFGPQLMMDQGIELFAEVYRFQILQRSVSFLNVNNDQNTFLILTQLQRILLRNQMTEYTQKMITIVFK